MKRVFLYFSLLILIVINACRDDESYKQNQPEPSAPGKIELVFTGRVGTVVGDSLSEYVHSLNLFLFREGSDGEYVLFRQRSLNKNQLKALADANIGTESGFTAFKEITFDSVPVANYKIVGLANALDSTGTAQPSVTISGATIGNTMSELLIAVRNGDQSPRLFLGTTETIQVGATGANPPVLRLYRKVSMFALTLLKIPDVVNRIDMEFENTYGSFNSGGTFTSGSGITVFASDEYTQQVQDSILLDYVMLPTIAGDSTSILATFYLISGPKQIVNLPKYLFRPNTITKVTATIDPDQAGNAWKVNVNSLITVNVEWNVDQEPPIKI